MASQPVDGLEGEDTLTCQPQYVHPDLGHSFGAQEAFRSNLGLELALRGKDAEPKVLSATMMSPLVSPATPVSAEAAQVSALGPRSGT